jgi:hypothetical protein
MTERNDVEYQRGDPNAERVQLLLKPSAGVLSAGSLRVAAPASANVLFSERVLSVAKAEADAHISRTSNKGRVTEYLALLDYGFADDKGVPVPYCAAGVTWATCKAYCDLNKVPYSDADRLTVLRSVLGDIGKLYFEPSAGCRPIMDDAKSRSKFVQDRASAQPGYLVFFNWSGAAEPEHIGVVSGLEGDGLHTIEFNTSADDGPNRGNGGAVATKIRSLNFVCGYVKTYG